MYEFSQHRRTDWGSHRKLILPASLLPPSHSHCPPISAAPPAIKRFRTEKHWGQCYLNNFCDWRRACRSHGKKIQLCEKTAMLDNGTRCTARGYSCVLLTLNLKLSSRDQNRTLETLITNALELTQIHHLLAAKNKSKVLRVSWSLSWWQPLRYVWPIIWAPLAVSGGAQGDLMSAHILQSL